jgi:FkbM family methyltransferase
MNDFFTTILRGRKVLLGRDFYQLRQVHRNRLTLGNRYAEWTFCPDTLNESSVVYSFGVGEDISFDLQLMKRFHLHIHAFDPSPQSVAWIHRQALPADFHFYPFGLASTDGEISFAEPADPGIHSLFATPSEEKAGTGLKQHVLPVHRLASIVQKLGHNKIDILKMDIEGAEYEVVEDIVASPVPVYQVLIEFHHRFPYIGVNRTREAISRLNRAGYKIFNVSPTGEEISLIKTDG